MKEARKFQSSSNLDYSRVEVAADARHRVCSCGRPSQMPCNEADAVRSARPKGKECQHRGKKWHGKRVECYAEGKINVTGRYR